ncbi:MAG: 4-hydroxy-tetrahydrodipicolinate reductase [Armatimonadetes bacterium]|nr:4-hydroxy-tetrahydrodipicolinate reductase [Armatimonadota bacterium]
MSEGDLRVLVIGAAGKMGQETMRAVSVAHDMELVGAVDKGERIESARSIAGPDVADIPVDNKLGSVLNATKPDVAIDFTHMLAAPEHAMSCLKRGVPVIIGTSGISPTDLSAIRESCREFSTPAALIPNFAVGAVLMVRFCELAAAWLPDVEIIERHHKAKLDAPSGTAMHTAECIAEARKEVPRATQGTTEKAAGARGGKVKDVTVHSVRLPGYVASQEVVFGGDGELLTVRHDSVDRRSFMPGVLLAVRQIRSFEGLVVGLDKFMFR